MIIVYNRGKEDHSAHPNNYPIYRGGSVLGNPYTDKPLKSSLAVFKAKNREEAIQKYDTYFDTQYGRNREFTAVIDEIYEKYKNGEDVFITKEPYSILSENLSASELNILQKE